MLSGTGARRLPSNSTCMPRGISVRVGCSGVWPENGGAASVESGNVRSSPLVTSTLLAGLFCYTLGPPAEAGWEGRRLRPGVVPTPQCMPADFALETASGDLRCPWSGGAETGSRVPGYQMAPRSPLARPGNHFPLVAGILSATPILEGAGRARPI